MRTYEFRSGTPAGDQFLAASRHAYQATLAVAAVTGWEPRRTDDFEAAAATSPAHAALLPWWGGAWKLSCPHLDGNPRPVGGLLARPCVIYCPPCAHLVSRAEAAADPDRCDACRSITRKFYEALFTVGPVTVHGNICRRCHHLAAAVKEGPR